MLGILSVLVVISLSILITRIGAIAMVHTGMARDAATFQARSAFTGVGFTTREAEQVTSHPVRRRIAMLLMFLGNAGIVTVISSLILGLINTGESGFSLLTRLLFLAMGLATLWLLARSSLVDRWLSRAISWALDRWTHLDVKDYAQLLHLSGDYSVRKLKVESEDWLEGRTLGELGLHAEGIHVLGIERPDESYLGVPRGSTSIDTGDLLILYGRDEAMEQLDHRRKGREGEQEHEDEVKRQQKEDEWEVLREERR